MVLILHVNVLMSMKIAFLVFIIALTVVCKVIMSAVVYAYMYFIIVHYKVPLLRFNADKLNCRSTNKGNNNQNVSVRRPSSAGIQCN